MPGVAIMTANESPSSKKYREPHERTDGPWDDYELEDAGRHLEATDKIKTNPKFVEAIAKHHEKRAKKHHKIASEMRHHMKAGHVSEKALARSMQHREKRD
jgi:hypothetical protein